jgi:serine/threonine protein kinase
MTLTDTPSRPDPFAAHQNHNFSAAIPYDSKTASRKTLSSNSSTTSSNLRHTQRPNSPTRIARTSATNYFSLKEKLGDSFVERDKIKFIRQVGQGSFARVDLGIIDGHEVAIKTLSADTFTDEREIINFLVEVRLLKNICHPSIVRFLGAGGSFAGADDRAELEDDLFLVQEYCAGGSLKDIVARQMMNPFKKIYSDAEALCWCIQIAAALTYMHSAKPKVIHRDLKLDNCLLTTLNVHEAECKLTDFGLAKLIHQNGPAIAGSSCLELSWGPGTGVDDSAWFGRIYRRKKLEEVLKKKNSIPVNLISLQASDCTIQTGSYAYMSPECLTSTKYDEKTDVFSFAMVAYNLTQRTIPSLQYMANGNPEDVEHFAREVAAGFRPPFAEGNSLPESLKEVIQMCWAANPDDRPTMREVLGKLKTIQKEGGCSSTVDSAGCCSIM